MVILKIFSAGVLLMIATGAQAQKRREKPDNPVKCTNIKDGKFLRRIIRNPYGI
jgi:hypothetical protein